MRIVYFCVLFLVPVAVFTVPVLACESCLISRLGKDSGMHSESVDKKLFFEYLFEQKNYDKIDPSQAHALHDDGHEIHDKTTEDFHHFIFGANVTEAVSLTLELPYVIRRSLEVESHDNLGQKQSSEGLGDLTLLGVYRFWKSGQQSLAGVAGLKFPTGYTGEKNTAGAKFEPELQPGTGSFDYIVGGVYNATLERLNIVTNMSYVINGEGRHDFQFGNMLTVSAAMDYWLNAKWNMLPIRGGLDWVFHHNAKEEHHGDKNTDSGGSIMLLGPVLSIGIVPQAAIFASIHFPIYQDLGGHHQQLDYEWTAGGKLSW